MAALSPRRARVPTIWGGVPRTRMLSAALIGFILCVLVTIEYAREICMKNNTKPNTVSEKLITLKVPLAHEMESIKKDTERYGPDGAQGRRASLYPLNVTHTTTIIQASDVAAVETSSTMLGAMMSLQALQHKRWSLDSGFGGDVTDTCEGVNSAAIASGEIHEESIFYLIFGC